MTPSPDGVAGARPSVDDVVIRTTGLHDASLRRLRPVRMRMPQAVRPLKTVGKH